MLSDGENDLDKISKILKQKKSIIMKITKLLDKEKTFKMYLLKKILNMNVMLRRGKTSRYNYFR